MKKVAKITAALVAVAAVSAPAFATTTGPDLSSLTSAVDMGTTITAILAIASTMAGLFVAMRGAKAVLGMIKGR